jgi:hypothetical protein
MKDFNALKTHLESSIDEHGLDDVLIALAQICADKALDDYGPLDYARNEMTQRLREASHYGTLSGRAAEWIKMADRIYELSHFYNTHAKCPDFVHPDFAE